MAQLLRSVVRTLYSRMTPPGARRTIDLWTEDLRPDQPPRPVDSFPERRVLALAPHMDDEAIGCGGALALHAQAGAHVQVAFTTDGSMGDPALFQPRGRRRIPRDEFVEMRKTESRRACEILGLAEPIFLDGPDGELSGHEQLTSALASLLQSEQPDLVYTPAIADQHPDHFATTKWLTCAIEREESFKAMRVREYEVWTPLRANCIVDIGTVEEKKRTALACFDSQADHLDVVGIGMSLARYRSMYHDGGRGLAEAFYECSAPTLAKRLSACFFTSSRQDSER